MKAGYGAGGRARLDLNRNSDPTGNCGYRMLSTNHLASDSIR